MYNWPVQPLLSALIQEKNLQFQVEIILLNDASTNESLVEQNKKSAGDFGAQWLQFEVNQGRAFTRNFLAEQARFNKILFIDVDSVPQQPDFLQRYFEAGLRADVVAGGTCYAKNPPDDPAKVLRWLYGKQREERTVALRQTEGFQKLSLNNFLINKALYLSIRLYEDLKQYGHEDTLFGMELNALQPTLTHIDNPVFHTGLDHAIEFLTKTEMAIENLYRLSKDFPQVKQLRLFAASSQLAGSSFGQLIYWAGNKLKRRLLNNLQSARPNVGYLDFLKVWLLIGKIQGKNPSLFS